MKYLDCTLICSACYHGRLPLPDGVQTQEEAVEYAKGRLNEIPLGEMQYITDSDTLDEENCFILDSESNKMLVP